MVKISFKRYEKKIGLPWRGKYECLFGLLTIALFSFWLRRLDDVPKYVLYFAPLGLVDKIGRATKTLLLYCDGAAPDVELEDVGEVEVVLQVEAERVVEDVGHVQPASLEIASWGAS